MFTLACGSAQPFTFEDTPFALPPVGRLLFHGFGVKTPFGYVKNH